MSQESNWIKLVTWLSPKIGFPIGFPQFQWISIGIAIGCSSHGMAWHGPGMAMFPICSPWPNHQHRGAVTMQLSAPWPLQAILGRSLRWTLRTNGVVIGGNRCEVVRVIASYCELLRQDISNNVVFLNNIKHELLRLMNNYVFLVIVVWWCFPCSWTKFNVGLGVWLMSAGKPIGTRSAGRWIVGWVKPSSAGIWFGNSCYLELDSIHEAILCFLPSLSTKLCILFIGSVNVPTLPCSHGNLDIQQSQSDLQDSWRQCASSADCFVTILCPSRHSNHLDWEWMCDVCAHFRPQMSIIVQCCCLHAMHPDDVYPCVSMHTSI